MDPARIVEAAAALSKAPVPDDAGFMEGLEVLSAGVNASPIISEAGRRSIERQATRMVCCGTISRISARALWPVSAFWTSPSFWQAPLAHILAGLGTTVIKVEAMEGDMTRAARPFHPADPERRHAGYFHSVNRNKRSIAVDLIYGALRGFGDPRSGASPFGDWPAYDVVAQDADLAVAGPPIKMSRYPQEKLRPGPGLGADTAAVLAALGYAADQVEDLRTSGVIR